MWYAIYALFTVMFAVILVQETRIHELKEELKKQPIEGNDEPTSSIPEDTQTLVENVIKLSR